MRRDLFANSNRSESPESDVPAFSKKFAIVIAVMLDKEVSVGNDPW